MCFASGSIFGNKFLTPVGIKTLFPIFENSLRGKELAVKTQAYKQRKYLPFILWQNIFKQVLFLFWKRRTCFSSCCMATFWLEGEVGGKPPFCFLVEVANSLPSFSLPFCNFFGQTNNGHTPSPMAGRERTDPNCCVG